METVTVSIGRNIGDAPMPSGQWHAFTADILRIVRRTAGEHGAVYFAGFGDGIYAGDGKESFTVVAAVPFYAWRGARHDIARLCETYSQDAIALTVGTTELVRSWSA